MTGRGEKQPEIGKVVYARLPWGTFRSIVAEVCGKPGCGWIYAVPFTWAGAQQPMMLARVAAKGKAIGWFWPP